MARIVDTDTNSESAFVVYIVFKEGKVTLLYAQMDVRRGKRYWLSMNVA